MAGMVWSIDQWNREQALRQRRAQGGSISEGGFARAASGRLSRVKPGAGGGGGFGGLIKQFQEAQDKANAANEARYQGALGQLEGLGTAGRTRIEQQTAQQQAQATQGLTSRGLGNTTITSAVSRGIAGDAETQRQQLDESVALQKSGIMERRTDEGPDMGMLMGLMQAMGQGGGGGGFGGGGARNFSRSFGGTFGQGADIFGNQRTNAPAKKKFPSRVSSFQN